MHPSFQAVHSYFSTEYLKINDQKQNDYFDGGIQLSNIHPLSFDCPLKPNCPHIFDHPPSYSPLVCDHPLMPDCLNK